MANLLKNSNFKFSDYDGNIIFWKPDYWERNQIEGNFYTYQISPDDHDSKNNGIRLWTGFDDNQEVGKGSIFQIARLVCNRIYKMSSQIRMKKEIVDGKEMFYGVGASIFLVHFDQDESDEALPIYSYNHFPVLLDKNDYNKWITRRAVELHVPHYAFSSIFKIGIIAGSGAGKFIDIDHLLLEDTGKTSNLPSLSVAKVKRVTPFFSMTRTGKKVMCRFSLKNLHKKTFFKVYAVELVILDNWENELGNFELFPYKKGWLNSNLLPKSITKIFDFSDNISNITGKLVVILGRCYLDKGMLEFKATAHI